MRSDEAEKALARVERKCRELRATVEIGGQRQPRIVLAMQRLKLYKQHGAPKSGGGGRSGGKSDPTVSASEDDAGKASAAMAAITEAELVSALLAMNNAVDDVARIVEGNVVTSSSRAKDPGCELCAAATVLKTGKPHPRSWQKAVARKAPAARAEEVVDIPRCSFHYEWAERYGVDANPVITIWHLDNPGRQVPYSMIKEQQPQAYERYHSERASRWATDGTGGAKSFAESYGARE